MAKNSAVLILTAIFAAVLLAACSAPTQAPTATPEPPTATFTAVPPTDTPAPTETPLPTTTATETNTPEPTLTPTITLTPTPVVDFSKFKLISVAKKDYGFQIGLQVPGLQSPTKLVIGTQPYTCQIDPAFPDKMFCIGPEVLLDTNMDIFFYTLEDNALIHQGVVYIPSSIFVYYPPGIDWNACPDRGKNVSCETEDRKWFDPPCIVSTCVDACGYFYSIDTCQQSTPPSWFPNE